MIKFESNDSAVLINALDDVPLLRDGKGNVDALVSFHSDIKIHRKFMRHYKLADNKQEKINLIQYWNSFMNMRNKEDFIPHFDSKNKLTYNSIFQ